MKEKIKQVTILSGLIILIVLGLVWLGNRSEVKNSASIDGNYSGILTVKESSYDFGTISMAKGKVSKEFVLENQSNGDVQIGQVFTSCMCTSAELRVGNKFAGPFGMAGMGFTADADLVVAPKDNLVVKAIFDPAAHGPAGIGPVERQISIFTSASKDPIVLEFKAIVTP